MDFPQLLYIVICTSVSCYLKEKNQRRHFLFFLRKGEACSDYKCLEMLAEISENKN